MMRKPTLQYECKSMLTANIDNVHSGKAGHLAPGSRFLTLMHTNVHF